VWVVKKKKKKKKKKKEKQVASEKNIWYTMMSWTVKTGPAKTPIYYRHT
jgi:hypothetical protein